MISNLGGKNELLHHGASGHANPVNISSLSQNQRVTATVEISKQTINTTVGSNAGGNSKRKNFKNMFYSPKNNNRDAFTEPHSKLAS
jgi:hypothetical protein